MPGFFTPKPPYTYNVNARLTKESIKVRTNNILKYVTLNQNYYWLSENLSPEEINSTKWKTYIYLRKCVLDYHAGNKAELDNMLDFLKENKKWLAGRLLDDPTQADDEEWGSGMHEWLERCLIVDVLKRSAGMVEGVEDQVELEDNLGSIDWLYIQAFIRSPTKYIFFRNDEYAIETGHPGAVKPDLSKSGFASKGSSGFHRGLENAFYESDTIEGFLKRIRNIFKLELYSGKKYIESSPNKKYLVDGTCTQNEGAVNTFRRGSLRPAGYNIFKELVSDTLYLVTDGGDNEQEDISEASSETTESETDQETESYVSEEASEISENDTDNESDCSEDLEEFSNLSISPRNG